METLFSLTFMGGFRGGAEGYAASLSKSESTKCKNECINSIQNVTYFFVCEAHTNLSVHENHVIERIKSRNEIKCYFFEQN